MRFSLNWFSPLVITLKAIFLEICIFHKYLSVFENVIYIKNDLHFLLKCYLYFILWMKIGKFKM